MSTFWDTIQNVWPVMEDGEQKADLTTPPCSDRATSKQNGPLFGRPRRLRSLSSAVAWCHGPFVRRPVVPAIESESRFVVKEIRWIEGCCCCCCCWRRCLSLLEPIAAIATAKLAAHAATARLPPDPPRKSYGKVENSCNSTNVSRCHWKYYSMHCYT